MKIDLPMTAQELKQYKKCRQQMASLAARWQVIAREVRRIEQTKMDQAGIAGMGGWRNGPHLMDEKLSVWILGV